MCNIYASMYMNVYILQSHAEKMFVFVTLAVRVSKLV